MNRTLQVLLTSAIIAVVLVYAYLSIIKAKLERDAVSRDQNPRRHYLVAPYLDLDRPGERGSYYALAEAGSCGRKSGPWAAGPWHGFAAAPRAGKGWRTPAYYWGRHDAYAGRGAAPRAWAAGAGAWRRH